MEIIITVMKYYLEKLNQLCLSPCAGLKIKQRSILNMSKKLDQNANSPLDFHPFYGHT